MDALKKAEQEKKEAAKRLKKSQGRGTEELKLTEKEEPPKKEKPGTASSLELSDSMEILDSTADREERERIYRELNEDDNSYPDLPVLGDNSGIDFAADTGGHQATDTDKDRTREDSGSHAGMDTSGPQSQQPGAPDADATLALTEATEDGRASPALDNTERDDSDVNLEISNKRLSKSVISAAELARDIGSGKDQPTPVAAQTVFTAVGTRQGPSPLYRWGVFTALCMVIAVAIGAFYYLSISPMTPEVNPTQVANTIETDPAIMTDIDEIRATATRPGDEEVVTQGTLVDKAGDEQVATVVESPEPAADEATTPAKTGGAAPEQTESDIAAAGEADTVAPAGTGDTAADMQSEPPASEEPAAAEPEPAPDPVAQKTLPEKITVTPEAIRISRSKRTDEQSRLINSAYADYVNGRYEGAAIQYETVLADYPENADALLGLAAIAHRQGNIQKAYDNYLKVLKYYPDNRSAKVALINLQGDKQPTENASAIKLLIQEQPQTPYLYFSLGNLYAEQARWPEAQQAFFDAYRLESTNPDYAFNLAVSLDRIGQYKAALDYYKAALDLADTAPVSFNKQRAIARVGVLSSNTGSN